MLEKKIDQSSIDLLKNFVLHKDDPSKMKQFLENSSLYKLNSGKLAIDELNLLSSNLSNFGSINNCIIDLSLARGLDYYTGIIVEAVLLKEDGTVSSSIAGGGRYDQLVGMFSGKDIPAVGASIGIERLMALLGDNISAEDNERKKVFVASIGN